MGLDITAFNHCKAQTKVSEDEYDSNWKKYEHTHCRVWCNEDFPDQSEGNVTGIYEVGEDEISFNAGSYHGYGSWRRDLARLGGYTGPAECWEGKSGPFSELINFSDCEGAIFAVTGKLIFVNTKIRLMLRMNTSRTNICISKKRSVWLRRVEWYHSIKLGDSG